MHRWQHSSIKQSGCLPRMAFAGSNKPEYKINVVTLDHYWGKVLLYKQVRGVGGGY